MGRFRQFVFFLLSLVLLPLCEAESYPSRTIKVLVGHAAGSPLDLRARQLAERLARNLGQIVVVENRVGAGGSIAVAAATQAAPDGYTLLYAGTGELSAAPSLYPALPYDPVRDLVPVGQLTRVPAILVTSPKSGVKSLAQLIERAKAKPDEITAASYGNGSLTHILLLELMHQAGVRFTHVPYKGASQALTDVIGGQVDVLFDFPITSRQHIQSARLVPLLIVGARRLSFLPAVPSASELGLQRVSLYAWNGLLAPKGTPAAVIARLQREFIAILRSSEMEMLLRESGSQKVTGTPDEFATTISVDLKRMREIVARTGARLD